MKVYPIDIMITLHIEREIRAENMFDLHYKVTETSGYLSDIISSRLQGHLNASEYKISTDYGIINPIQQLASAILGNPEGEGNGKRVY